MAEKPFIVADSYNPKAKALHNLKRTTRPKIDLTESHKVKESLADKPPTPPRRLSARED
jgi:hypothetical protein